MAVPSPTELREAMARMPTAVTIVSALGSRGPAGATANAVASLSLSPPLVLACLDRGSRTLTVIRETGAFAVNVLSVTQAELARAFASKAPHTEKWHEVDHDECRGSPVLADAVTWAACRLRGLHDGGDHEIAVGQVLALGGAGGEPLIFIGGSYRGLGGQD
jgi:flavin reductase (DIM6/NTAB) family NADH-FMN oxidoreductase RutF